MRRRRTSWPRKRSRQTALFPYPVFTSANCKVMGLIFGLNTKKPRSALEFEAPKNWRSCSVEQAARPHGRASRNVSWIDL
jgi:hypothetical protein